MTGTLCGFAPPWSTLDPYADNHSTNVSYSEAGSSASGTHHDLLMTLTQKMPDIKVARGLSLLLGDAGKYLRLLHQYVTSHGADPGQLAQYLTRDDRVSARRLLHTLKGTAGTLGIDSVAETTRRLERLLSPDRDLQPLPEGTHQEVDQLSAYFSTLAANLPVPAPAVLAPVAPDDKSGDQHAALSVNLSQLVALLARNDAAAINFMEENEAPLRAVLGSAYETISTCIGQFDFESALGIMNGPPSEVQH